MKAWMSTEQAIDTARAEPLSTRRAVPTARVIATFAAIGALEVAAIALTWDASDWRPVSLFVVLAAGCALGEWWPIEVRGVQTSTSGFILVLPMALLGPGPAAAIGLLTVAVDSHRRRPTPAQMLVNALCYVGFTLVGAAVFDVLESAGALASPTGLAVFVFAVALIVDVVSFLMIAAWERVDAARSIAKILRGTYGPIGAYHVVLSTLVAAAAYAYVEVGLAALVSFLLVMRVSDVLLRAVASADARAAEIEELAAQRAIFLTQSLVAEEHERRKLAGHLHDEALQLLAAAGQDLEEAAEGDAAALDRGRRNVHGAVDEMRRTLTHFHPMSVTNDGLQAALETLTRQLCRRSEPVVEVAARVAVSDPTLLYTVARELIGNAAKHAGARRIRVILERERDAVRLVVDDDGTGFDVEDLPEAGHIGLLLTRHRVEAAGGKFSLSSAAGSGTTATVELPAALAS
jgi:signal transduction histidine kinase